MMLSTGRAGADGVGVVAQLQVRHADEGLAQRALGAAVAAASAHRREPLERGRRP